MTETQEAAMHINISNNGDMNNFENSSDVEIDIDDSENLENRNSIHQDTPMVARFNLGQIKNVTAYSNSSSNNENDKHDVSAKFEDFDSGDHFQKLKFNDVNRSNITIMEENANADNYFEENSNSPTEENDIDLSSRECTPEKSENQIDKSNESNHNIPIDESNEYYDDDDCMINSKSSSILFPLDSTKHINDIVKLLRLDTTDIPTLKTYHQPPKAVDRDSAKRLAKRLYDCNGFKTTDVAKHLSKRNDFYQIVGEEFSKFFDFTEVRLDKALRQFLGKFTLIGETQERERIMHHFSRRYVVCNMDTYNGEDACHTLVCALIILNTNLHSQIFPKMTCADFINNLKDLNEGEDFNPDNLKELYESIEQEPIRWPVDEEMANIVNLNKPDMMEASKQQYIPAPTFPTFTFDINPQDSDSREFMSGFIVRKWLKEPGGRKTSIGKRGWRTFQAHLRDLTIYLYKNSTDSNFSNSHNNKQCLHNNRSAILESSPALTTSSTENLPTKRKNAKKIISRKSSGSSVKKANKKLQATNEKSDEPQEASVPKQVDISSDKQVSRDDDGSSANKESQDVTMIETVNSDIPLINNDIINCTGLNNNESKDKDTSEECNSSDDKKDIDTAESVVDTDKKININKENEPQQDCPDQSSEPVPKLEPEIPLSEPPIITTNNNCFSESQANMNPLLNQQAVLFSQQSMMTSVNNTMSGVAGIPMTSSMGIYNTYDVNSSLMYTNATNISQGSLSMSSLSPSLNMQSSPSSSPNSSLILRPSHYEIHINHALATEATDYTKKKFVLRITTKYGSEYLFQVNTRKELESWIDNINYAAALLSDPEPIIGMSTMERMNSKSIPMPKITNLSMRDQFESHQKCILELQKAISDLKENPPKKNDKKMKHEIEEAIRFRNQELNRYRTYSQLLEVEMMNMIATRNNSILSASGTHPFPTFPYITAPGGAGGPGIIGVHSNGRISGGPMPDPNSIITNGSNNNSGGFIYQQQNPIMMSFPPTNNPVVNTNNNTSNTMNPAAFQHLYIPPHQPGNTNIPNPLLVSSQNNTFYIPQATNQHQFTQQQIKHNQLIPFPITNNSVVQSPSTVSQFSANQTLTNSKMMMLITNNKQRILKKYNQHKRKVFISNVSTNTDGSKELYTTATLDTTQASMTTITSSVSPQSSIVEPANNDNIEIDNNIINAVIPAPNTTFYEIV